MVKDIMAVANVFASLLRNPMLLMDDKYPLVPDDFPERYHKIIFGAIDYLVHNGAKQIDEVIIDDYLMQYPSQHKQFEENRGIEYIQRALDTISTVDNFEYYYDQLKKCSLLNKLEAMGYDIRFYHYPTAPKPEELQLSQENFNKATLDDILSHYDVQLSSLRSQYCSSSDLVEGHISKGMRDLKNELAETPAFGLPMNSAKMNTICHGRRLRKFYLKTIPSGIGKALPNDMLIPTFDKGFQYVGDIHPGDRLIGKDGKPTTVLAIHPQPEKKQVYRVHFADGRFVDCCKDHLWTYRYERHQTRCRTETTEQLLNRALALDTPFKQNGKGGWAFKVPLCEPVQYSAKNFSIPPYVMGAMLGDASFRTSAKSRTLYHSSEDDWIPQKIASYYGWSVHKNSANNYSYRFKDASNANVHVDEFLSAYPELIEAKSQSKHIPYEYLFGSYEQRLELLQGLLDTDGHIDFKGRVSFSTTSRHLKDEFVTLCHSMGFIVRVADDGRDKYASGVAYRIMISCAKSMKPDLFTLPRKKTMAEEYASNGKREEYNQWLAITNIEALDQYKDMTCFTVDAEDALFLCKDYIVTHNTRISMADACRLAVPQYYDPDKKRWVKTKCAESVLFITTELEISEIQTLTWAYVACVPEDHITDNKYEPGEEARVEKAIALLEKANFFSVYIANFSIDDIENIIKRYKMQYDVSYVFFDYIFSSSKVLTEMSQKAKGFKLREDQSLMVFSERLKTMCNKYNVHIDSSTQANDDWKTQKNPDQSVIRGAKAIADKVDVGYIGLEPSEKDKQVIHKIMPQLGMGFMPEPNMVYHVYKVRRGKINHVKVFVRFDYGTLRTTDMFVTDRDYKLLDVKNTNIEVLLEQTDVTEEAKKQVTKETHQLIWR